MGLRKTFLFLCLVCIALVCIALVGCAGTPRKLNSNDVDKIRRVAFILECKEGAPQIIDHTDVWNKTYTGGQFGAIGGVLEGLILSSEASSKIAYSMGGDPSGIKEISVKAAVEDLLKHHILSRMGTQFEIIDLNGAMAGKEGDTPIHSDGDYIETCRRENIDTFARIVFIYGLAAFVGEPASVAIDADVKVWNVASGKAIAEKVISSNKVYRNGNSINAFKMDSSQLFNDDLIKASDGVALQFSNMFLLYIDEYLEKRISEAVLSTSTVSCSRPYKLSQDCSGWNGAKRTIEIEGRRLKIAGTKEGNVVLVMDDKYFSNMMSNALTLGIRDKGTAEVVQCGNAVEDFLKENGIGINEKYKMVSNTSLDGYVLVLDGDGYSLLKGHSVSD